MLLSHLSSLTVNEQNKKPIPLEEVGLKFVIIGVDTAPNILHEGAQ
jgi:hypothetical protein